MTVAHERFLADRAAPLCSLDIAKPFGLLRYTNVSVAQFILIVCPLFPYLVPRSSKEKKYAHCMSEAAWAGARIIQGQWTEHAQSLYDMIILVFSQNGKLANLEALKTKSGVSDEEWEDLLQYSSQVRAQSCGLPFKSNTELRS